MNNFGNFHGLFFANTADKLFFNKTAASGLIQPSERAAQFVRAAGFVAAAVRQYDFFRLPVQHLLQAGAGGWFFL